MQELGNLKDQYAIVVRNADGVTSTVIGHVRIKLSQIFLVLFVE